METNQFIGENWENRKLIRTPPLNVEFLKRLDLKIKEKPQIWELSNRYFPISHYLKIMAFYTV